MSTAIRRSSRRGLKPSESDAEESYVGISSYRGAFGEAQAARLLWRAGFGPAPGQAAELAKLGLRDAARSLTRPRSVRLVGPSPSVDGSGLAPRDAWGHDHLWWLDRMVRTQAPLVERMTPVWHG